MGICRSVSEVCVEKKSFIKCNVGDGNLENIFQRWMQLIQFSVGCRQKSNNDV